MADNINKVINIFYEFIFRYPIAFVTLITLILFEGVLTASAIITIIPIADFLLDPELNNPSKITDYLLRLFNYYSIESNFISFSIIFIISNFLKAVFEIFVRYSILNVKYSVLRGMTKETLIDFFNAKWIFFSNSEQGKLLNTFSKELKIVGDALGNLTTQLAHFLQFVIYLTIPLWINHSMTIYAIIICIILASPILLLHRYSYKLGRLNTNSSNELLSILSESITSAKIVLGFANQSQTIQKFMKSYDVHIFATLRSQTLDISIPTMFQPLGMVAAVIAIGTGINKGVILPDMAAIMWALLRALPLLGSVLRSNISLSNFLPSYEQLVSLRTQAQKLAEICGTRIYKKLHESIVFEKVKFVYTNRLTTLNDINIKIPKGQITALVGESGSGKSTISDLLMGLLQPDEGQILVDGHPLPEFDLNSYRKKIGFVPQEPILFNCSIKDNLLWACKSATDDEMIGVCKMSNSYSFIEKLPFGMDTIVGNRGVRLSGGQKQRIALARALLGTPEILILDEATSSLDTESEILIQKTIDNLSKNLTILVIAHRLSTVKNANNIYVLKDGGIEESGTFDSLISKPDGLFNKMVINQHAAA